MNGRVLPLVTVLLGLVTLAVFFWLGLSPEVGAVYDRAEVSQAVSAFQRSVSAADLALVFGDPPNTAVMAAQDSINTRDLYAFVPAYALFLCAAALMLSGRMRGVLVWAAIIFAVCGALADAIETSIQLRITADYANASEYLPVATWHWLKYAGLALNGAAVAGLCFTPARRRRVLGLIALAPLPLVVMAYAGLISPRLFAGAFAAYWIALLVAAVMETVRPKGAWA